MTQLSAEQVNRFQRTGLMHPLTCRFCRGRGTCERTDVGSVGGDHHVLEAHDSADGVVLVCECCGGRQILAGELHGIVRRMVQAIENPEIPHE